MRNPQQKGKRNKPSSFGMICLSCRWKDVPLSTTTTSTSTLTLTKVEQRMSTTKSSHVEDEKNEIYEKKPIQHWIFWKSISTKDIVFDISSFFHTLFVICMTPLTEYEDDSSFSIIYPPLYEWFEQLRPFLMYTTKENESWISLCNVKIYVKETFDSSTFLYEEDIEKYEREYPCWLQLLSFMEYRTDFENIYTIQKEWKGQSPISQSSRMFHQHQWKRRILFGFIEKT